MKIHESLTEDVILEAVKAGMFGLENPGFCIACGAERDGCEPDARKYPCEECGRDEVYGAEEIMISAY